MAKQLQLRGGEFVALCRDTLSLLRDFCHRNRRAKIFFATFFSEKSAPTLLGGLPSEFKSTRKADYWVVSSGRRARKKWAKQIFGLFQSGEKAWTAFTPTETAVTESLLLRLLGSLSPDLSEAYLTSSDIRGILEQLEEHPGGIVSVNKAVAYSHRREGQISFFKNEPYDAVFNKAENEGKFVDKVDFSLTGPRPLHGFIGRNGVAKFMMGDMKLFQDTILTPIAQTSSRKHQVFRESSRQPGSKDVSAIDINFEETVFRGRQDNLIFISSLDRMTRSGIAVLHENPYVHVSLIDFFDGSAFDVFATSRRAVTIVPQVGASPFSMNRLCNHIFENFREGVIAKPEEKRWTLEDVLT